MIMQSIFGTDGIRGKVNKRWLLSSIQSWFALGLTENNNPILIGRDTRVSGKFCQAITSGISASGKIYKSWNLPYPAILLIKKQKMSSGIMISASHNP